MEFRILGPLEVINDGDLVRLGGVKPRALLTVLLLNANQPVSAERLALALWGEDAPSGAVKTVQVHVSRLRKALGDGDMLVTTPVGYRLRVRAGELDADRFVELVEDGRRALDAGQVARAAAVVREALSLWRGSPLEDVAYEPFAQGEIARLEEQKLSALEIRVEADLAAGNHAGVIGELQRLVTLYPARERLAGQLMLALYRCGRQGEALDVYARTRAFLAGDLGLDPGPGLQALQRAILEQAPSLNLQGLAAGEETAGMSDPEHAVHVPLFLAAGADDAFVGRAPDVAALARVFDEVAGGARRLMLVCGEPGAGKTRLAAAFAQRVHEQGAIVLYGRCDEEALLAQQPFVEALRHYVRTCPAHDLAGQLQRVSGELQRIVPELADRVPDLPEPLAGDPEGARSRLFEAVGSLLCEAAQSTPVVLILDDLHWADKATVLLLKYVVRYPRAARLMILGMYRETDLGVDHALNAMLADLGREHHFERLTLAPLDPAAVSELVGALADEASPELGQIVYDGTEGNAFFVVEVLRHLVESGAIGIVDPEPEFGIATSRLAVPESVKDVIDRRVARLGQQTNRLLATASVLGSEFELRVLQRLGVLTEDEVVDGLESAVRARVLDEMGGSAGRYTFSHALIRDSVYGALSATRRALLHRRAGAALEEVHAGDLDPYFTELAYHFAQAGLSGDLDKAVEYGTRAGEHSIAQSAYEQAACHFRRTVELIDAAGGNRLRGKRCDLVIAAGEAERQAGDPAYRQTLLGAARLAQELHDPERLALAALANTRGVFSSGLGIDRERVATLRAALDAYDPADSPTRAALLAQLALEHVPDHDASLREQLNEAAVAMARRVGEPRTLALVLTRRCVAQWERSQSLAERQSNLREALEIADRLGDPLLAGHAAYLGAHTAMNMGDLEEGDHLLARLTAIAEQLGQPFMRWYDVVARVKRLTISGPVDEAERLAFVALEIAQRGGMPDQMLWFLGQLFAVRFLQGTLASGDPYMPDLFPTPGAYLPAGPDIAASRAPAVLVGAGISAILCEVDRLDDARGHFEWLMSTGLDELTPDYTALAIPAFATIACVRLGDIRRAERLYAIMEPQSDRPVITGSTWFGTTSHFLGRLAAILDRPDDAEAWFAEAERTYASLNAEPWLARLRRDRAEARPDSGQRDTQGAAAPLT